MRYIFDTDNRNGQYNIKISVQPNNGGQIQTVERIIWALNSDPNRYRTQAKCSTDIESILNDILDNIRFTVAERYNAIDDVEKFVKYITNKESSSTESIDDIINEDNADKNIELNDIENDIKLNTFDE